jgi:hypothetical protein
MNNRITKIENLPESLQKFYCDSNQIQFVDNVTIHDYEKFFGRFNVRDYTKIKKCQRVMTKWFHRRKRKACVIQRVLENWIWKPVCRDGTYSVRLRLDTKELGLNPD